MTQKEKKVQRRKILLLVLLVALGNFASAVLQWLFFRPQITCSCVIPQSDSFTTQMYHGGRL